MSNFNLIFSIWDKNETSLFHSSDYDEIINEIGTFPAPLYRVGDKIKVDNKKRTITNVFFGISESKERVRIVVEVE